VRAFARRSVPGLRDVRSNPLIGNLDFGIETVSIAERIISQRELRWERYNLSLTGVPFPSTSLAELPTIFPRARITLARPRGVSTE
jgi:hypothetical protein